MPTVLAAADIGSNTAHLLVARIGLSGIARIHNESEWLSLGEVVSHEGTIPKELVGRLVEVLKSFKAKAALMQSEGIYVFATEAVRRARNHKEVVRFVRKETGLQVDLVTPRREAELGLKGAMLDSPMAGRFVFAESGGGSVQVAVCDGPEILEETSMPIGTGVLIDQSGLTHPTSSGQFDILKLTVDTSIQMSPRTAAVTGIVASGGVARGLWRALHPDGDTTLFKEELQHLVWSVRRLDLQTISARYSVKAKRAATLLPGSMVYLALMERFQTATMTVSQYGVREGAILELSQGRIVPCPL